MHAQARSNACLPALPHHSPHASCSAIPHRQSLARCASCRFHPSICQPKPLLLPRCATVHCTSDTPPNTTTHTPGQPAMQVRSSHSSMPTTMPICHPSASLAVSFFGRLVCLHMHAFQLQGGRSQKEAATNTQPTHTLLARTRCGTAVRTIPHSTGSPKLPRFCQCRVLKVCRFILRHSVCAAFRQRSSKDHCPCWQRGLTRGGRCTLVACLTHLCRIL